MKKILLNESLQELEGEDWGDPDKQPTELTRTCYALRRIPLKDFTNDNLRRMIQQRIGLEYIIPIALSKLTYNPLNSGDTYTGDLLGSLLEVDMEFWRNNPELHEELDSTVLELRMAYETLEPLLKNYKGENQL